MNLAFLLDMAVVAQASPGDHVSWLSVVLIAVFVAIFAIYASMRRSGNPRLDRKNEERVGDEYAPERPHASARRYR